MAAPEVFGRWTRGEKIGDGGQGDVYQATGGEGEALVAIKVIKTTRSKNRTRFQTEVRVQADLSDAKAPNVMPILDHNLQEVENGAVRGYIVMPLAITNLEDQKALLRGRLELCLEIFLGILIGVGQAHSKGVIHRDLKPDNILFVDSTLRTPLVSDFGICLLRDTADAARITEPNETVGARWFMSPEQQRGGITDVTPAADIYTLGKLLTYMLTNSLMFREEIEQAFTTDEIAAEPRLALVRDQLLRRVVLEHPANRIQTIEELNRIVQSIRRGPGNSGVATSPPPEQPSVGESLEPRLHRLFSAINTQISNDQFKGLRLRFTSVRQEFDRTWARIKASGAFENIGAGKLIVKQLLDSQTEAIALAVAIARSDETALFADLKSLIEYFTTVAANEPGFPQLTTAPQVLGGFLYMAASVTALGAESWGVLDPLLSETFRYLYRSDRPLFTLGFGSPMFFHAEAMGRSASETHDLFRARLEDGEIRMASGSVVEPLTTYAQTQFLMSVRGAQANESDGGVRMWADFGRFHKERITPLIDRIRGDPRFSQDVLRSFREPRDQWLARLNGRLESIRINFWGEGSGFMWDSIRPWESQ